mgnify:FL=1
MIKYYRQYCLYKRKIKLPLLDRIRRVFNSAKMPLKYRFQLHSNGIDNLIRRKINQRDIAYFFVLIPLRDEHNDS